MFHAIADQHAADALRAFDAAVHAEQGMADRDAQLLAQCNANVASLKSTISELGAAITSRRDELADIAIEMARLEQLAEAKFAELASLKQDEHDIDAPRCDLTTAADALQAATDDMLESLIDRVVNTSLPTILTSVAVNDPVALRASVEQRRLEIEAIEGRNAASAALLDRLRRQLQEQQQYPATGPDAASPIEAASHHQTATETAELQLVRDHYAAQKAQDNSALQAAQNERDRLRRLVRETSRGIEKISTDHEAAIQRCRDVIDALAAAGTSCRACGALLHDSINAAMSADPVTDGAAAGVPA